MTPCKRGQVVLTPFPFTDKKGAKTRPAVVISTDEYNRASTDVVLAPITSQLAVRRLPGDYRLRRWTEAGLNVPSVVRARVTTVHAKWVTRTIGVMPPEEMIAINKNLRTALGL